jgi:hypothetical protein
MKIIIAQAQSHNPFKNLNSSKILKISMFVTAQLFINHKGYNFTSEDTITNLQD